VKTLLFLYPHEQYFEHQIGWRPFPEFPDQYAARLKECIDARYRQHEYRVAWARFPDLPISALAPVENNDIIISASITFKRHTMEQRAGYEYPSVGRLFVQLPHISSLRVGGFHLWDCVQRVARHAYAAGIHTIVDEDLTEISATRLFQQGIDIARFTPPEPIPSFYDQFIESRKDKPWMAQPTVRQ
jgi:hypothetical protein